MIQFIDYLKAHERGARYWFYGLMIAIVLGSLFVDTHHAHTWMEKYIPGFWSIFGILSSIILIFFARWLAGAGIERKEDFYDC